MELGSLLALFGLPHPEVSFQWPSLVPSAFGAYFFLLLNCHLKLYINSNFCALIIIYS